MSITVLDNRVSAVILTDDPKENIQKITTVAEERNLLVDVSAANNPIPTFSCIQALSFRATAVFSGGVQSEIPIPYGMMLGKELTIKGSFMYPRTAPAELLRMIGSTLINLDMFNFKSFQLGDVNEAIKHASTLKGLDYCVLTP